MSVSKQSLSEKRKQLSEEIARQRVDLSVAYRGLIKPFQYAETGIAGLNVLKKNGWLIALAPSVVSLVFSFMGWQKPEKPGLLGRFRKKSKNVEAAEEEEIAAKIKKPMSRWARRAWSAFQVYRRVRPYIPFP